MRETKGMKKRTARVVAAVLLGFSASLLAAEPPKGVAQQQAQVPQQQAATAQAQAAAAKLPVGTTVSALPQGCTSAQVSGTSYFNCGGTYYKPGYQSNNVVYVVAQS